LFTSAVLWPVECATCIEKWPTTKDETGKSSKLHTDICIYGYYTRIALAYIRRVI